eukprot:m.356473 g.356473  ORF g.356473 m.356473 type:complete len:161 (+) comp55956_c0_seq3:345-827(+)
MLPRSSRSPKMNARRERSGTPFDAVVVFETAVVVVDDGIADDGEVDVFAVTGAAVADVADVAAVRVVVVAEAVVIAAVRAEVDVVDAVVIVVVVRVVDFVVVVAVAVIVVVNTDLAQAPVVGSRFNNTSPNVFRHALKAHEAPGIPHSNVNMEEFELEQA